MPINRTKNIVELPNINGPNCSSQHALSSRKNLSVKVLWTCCLLQTFSGIKIGVDEVYHILEAVLFNNFHWIVGRHPAGRSGAAARWSTTEAT